MKFLNIMLLGAFLVSAPLMLTACEEQSSLEEGVEEVGDEIDDAS